MANIKVKDLTQCSITGIDLFDDSESFIQDLSEYELNLQGGGYHRTVYYPKYQSPVIQYA
jgi:hypothetical protein